jgi:phosphoenolpyruvate---glycerone phosphotransferase subunit DhaL
MAHDVLPTGERARDDPTQEVFAVMQNRQQVDVGSLLNSVASMLDQNQDRLNETDAGGTHGKRVANAFKNAAAAARSAPTEDAGDQLRIAAQEMRRTGQGKAVAYYADGLENAATQFDGRSGISQGDLQPFLQSFLGGVQQNNPAQPGQGTMLDALIPAVTEFISAKQQGRDTTQAAMSALGSAVTGAKSTGSHRRGRGGVPLDGSFGNAGSNIDPGAASATNVLGGIVGALLPSVLGAVSQGGGMSQQGQPSSRDAYGQDQEQQADPLGALGGLGGLGGIVGGLLGDQGGGNDAQQGRGSRASSSWWPF